MGRIHAAVLPLLLLASHGHSLAIPPSRTEKRDTEDKKDEDDYYPPTITVYNQPPAYISPALSYNEPLPPIVVSPAYGYNGGYDDYDDYVDRDGYHHRRHRYRPQPDYVPVQVLHAPKEKRSDENAKPPPRKDTKDLQATRQLPLMHAPPQKRQYTHITLPNYPYPTTPPQYYDPNYRPRNPSWTDTHDLTATRTVFPPLTAPTSNAPPYYDPYADGFGYEPEDPGFYDDEQPPYDPDYDYPPATRETIYPTPNYVPPSALPVIQGPGYGYPDYPNYHPYVTLPRLLPTYQPTYQPIPTYYQPRPSIIVGNQPFQTYQPGRPSVIVGSQPFQTYQPGRPSVIVGDQPLPTYQPGRPSIITGDNPPQPGRPSVISGDNDAQPGRPSVISGGDAQPARPSVISGDSAQPSVVSSNASVAAETGRPSVITRRSVNEDVKSAENTKPFAARLHGGQAGTHKSGTPFWNKGQRASDVNVPTVADVQPVTSDEVLKTPVVVEKRDEAKSAEEGTAEAPPNKPFAARLHGGQAGFHAPGTAYWGKGRVSQYDPLEILEEKGYPIPGEQK